MKIQCDVCDKDEASVFCVADEAALCAACDHRVHHANKLAGKHHRFSLHHPSPNQSPLCDICQEGRAFLFCQQDRAILCRDCDISIHKANEHTLKHTRFLLTGVKLSSTSALYSDTVPNIKSTTGQSSGLSAPESFDKFNSQLMVNSNGPISASSISEYLIETLPGWQVEEFLDFPSHKNVENDGLPFWGAGFDAKMSERMGVGGVPQAVPTPLNQSFKSGDFISFGASNGFKDQCKDFGTNNLKSSRKRSEDNSFAVPQISPPSSAAFNGSRTLW